MKKILREPLLHFLLLGAALFGVYAALNRSNAPPPEDIVVTSGQIESLSTSFMKIWHRPPSATELKGLIDGHVQEEILSREAIKLGLDQNDTVIRRRLQQKMEFLTEDFATTSEPTDTELADYLAQHADQFAQEQRFTFRHVFLNPEKRGDQLDAVTAALLARLQQHPDSDISDLGDSLLLPPEFTSEAQRDVAAQFGKDFAADLAKLPVNQWRGPLRSSYGTHLVLITQHTAGRPALLADVRADVKRELINARRLEMKQKFLDSLLARYRITIEPLPSAPASTVRETALNR